MKIKASNTVVTINGNIKSIGDFQMIKNTMDSMINNNKSITINIIDSISITSSIIVYLKKLILEDGIKIQMYIKNSKLLNLLIDLNLQSTFKTTKIYEKIS